MTAHDGIYIWLVHGRNLMRSPYPAWTVRTCSSFLVKVVVIWHCPLFHCHCTVTIGYLVHSYLLSQTPRGSQGHQRGLGDHFTNRNLLIETNDLYIPIRCQAGVLASWPTQRRLMRPREMLVRRRFIFTGRSSRRKSTGGRATWSSVFLGAQK